MSSYEFKAAGIVPYRFVNDELEILLAVQVRSNNNPKKELLLHALGGRRMENEYANECAIREFLEETSSLHNRFLESDLLANVKFSTYIPSGKYKLFVFDIHYLSPESQDYLNQLPLSFTSNREVEYLVWISPLKLSDSEFGISQFFKYSILPAVKQILRIR
ncbi:hypothetical protein GEMRC1_011970 [Eukaryota sp. GEM-RC1]